MLWLVSAAPLYGQTFEDGVDAYDTEDYARAVEIWEALAQEGHVMSQYNLGLLYENGLGVPQRHDLAFFWYRMAALNGNASAKYNLRGLYYHGLGVEQSVEQAVRWWEEAANAGDPNGAYNLGVVMLQSSNDEASVKAAMIRLKQAADAGHPHAAELLEELSAQVEMPRSMFFSAAPRVPAIEELMDPGAAAASAPAAQRPADRAAADSTQSGGGAPVGDDPVTALNIGRHWIDLQPDDNYTVKIFAFFEPRVALWYLKKWGFGGPGAMFAERGEYSIVLGSFTSRGTAKRFLDRLLDHVPEVRHKTQRVVRFDDVKKDVGYPGG
ncbi:MAG: sel1 repeat family protein [Gammaproteobacteria bacterium]|nr:sel1 repeat family protein [Gammaproteobacteria bacterium]